RARAEASGSSRVVAGSCQSPHLRFFARMSEAGALPSIGVTRLPRYYGPLRLLPGNPDLGPPPQAALRLAPHQGRSPTLPVTPSRRAVPITPVDRSGAHVGRFPLRAA